MDGRNRTRIRHTAVRAKSATAVIPPVSSLPWQRALQVRARLPTVAPTVESEVGHDHQEASLQREEALFDREEAHFLAWFVPVEGCDTDADVAGDRIDP